MPTPQETTRSLAASKAALVACKKALMPRALKHPLVAETETDEYGAVLIDRKSYYAALAAVAEYEATIAHLGGKNAADVEPAPEETHKGDEEAINASLDALRSS